MEDPRRGSSVPPGAAEIFAPSFPVTPPKACAALWYKRRRGDTELCGALAGCPLSRLAATASRLLALSVTAAAVPAPPRGEPSLASPFGGRWCPVGTVQRLTEPAGESALQRRAERATRPRRARALVARTGAAFSRRPKARIDSGGTPPAGKDASLFP